MLNESHKKGMVLVVRNKWHFLESCEQKRQRFRNPNLKLVKGVGKRKNFHEIQRQNQSNTNESNNRINLKN
jgi:hypothetical protein